VDDDVEGDGGDGGECADAGEGEESLVGATDGDAGWCGPVGCVAGGEDGVGHAPAQEAKGDEPEDEEDGVGEEGEAWREAIAAVGEAGEDVIEDREECRHDELDDGEVGFEMVCKA
jgi:hypothetical protein